MSCLMALMLNDPERVGCALFPGRRQLVADAREADGWGIGFYQGEEVLLQRHPKRPKGEVDFYALGSKLRTEALVGYACRSAIGSERLENTQPFRFRSWLLAHHGTIGNFADIHEGLVRCVPDFLRRNIRGQTDSEHFFHLFLSFLHDSGKLDDPLIAVKAAGDALRQALALLRRLSGSAMAEINLVLTNGRILLAVRRGNPLYFYRLSGVWGCAACKSGEDFGHEPAVINHENLRAVVLTAAPASLISPPWEELPDDHLLAVGHDLNVEVSSL